MVSIDAPKYKIRTIADIYYMDESILTVRRCYNATRLGYLAIAEEMAKTHEVTKVEITEMVYDCKTESYIRDIEYLYEMRDGKFVETDKSIIPL